MNISLCLTNFNRTELLYDSFHEVIQDPRISEIVISDDCSQVELYNTVVWQFKTIDKVKIYRNEVNLDCYKNKARALGLATNPWCILFDSDNKLIVQYLDRLESLWQAGLNEKTIYQPEFARPHFDFRHLSGTNLTKANIGHYIKKGNTGTMLNAMNYFVNKHEYLKVFDPTVDPVTSDSIYQNYRWLAAGNAIYVVEGLQYDHRVHDQSHYKNNVSRTPNGFHDEILEKLKQMR